MIADKDFAATPPKKPQAVLPETVERTYGAIQSIEVRDMDYNDHEQFGDSEFKVKVEDDCVEIDFTGGEE